MLWEDSVAKNYYCDDRSRIRKLIRSVEEDMGYKEGELLKLKHGTKLISRSLKDYFERTYS